MKLKHFVALLLVLVGTNLFTFATARYWTTEDVLTRAQNNMDAALKAEGLYEQVYYPSGRPGSMALRGAISQAGGMYFWWNDGLICWGAGVLCTLSGFAVASYEPKAKTKDEG